MPCPLIRDYTHWRAKIDCFARFALLFLILSSCNGIERAENEKIRRRNCKGEYIYRSHSDQTPFAIEPRHTPRNSYPWERSSAKITKDFFRCKGDPSHSPLPNEKEPENPIRDCEGSQRHGLPIIQGKENVYPVLIDLLNHVQEKTGKKVIITCGHRCPKHNSYCDPSKENLVSKHQIGAEVDFYVQGLENEPLAVVDALIDYYQNTPLQTFQRYEKKDVRVSTPPWMNREVFIQLFLPHEGRDLDNTHTHPYISVQVRYDPTTKKRVVYEWKTAHLGYPRG